MSDLPQIGPAEPVSEPAQATPVNDEVPANTKPFAPIIGFLDVGESELTPKTQAALQEIWDFVGKDAKTTVDKLYALRTLESKIAPPRIGQTRLQKLHAYVLAQKEVEKAEAWRNQVMGGIRG